LVFDVFAIGNTKTINDVISNQEKLTDHWVEKSHIRKNYDRMYKVSMEIKRGNDYHSSKSWQRFS
jgi:hypothetical protein